ncbi:MAG: NmrA family NAD(P)-binding protein [Sandaracinus sp.]|nr:NmrA family NAD(P)-binding protein [Sandaracinus sp.]
MTVVVGGKGKTGRRVVARLKALGLPVRAVSPSTHVPFDWNDPSTWAAALEGAKQLYLTYHPDLAVPGAAERVGALSRFAVAQGVEKIVLLAGRGEPQVHAAERAVKESGVARWTVLECAFFMQNFTEGLLVPRQDVIAFAGGDVREPFVDCDDIAACAVAALTDDRHTGKTYELTGPESLTFGEATAILGAASGRPLRFVSLSFPELGDALAQDFPPPVVAFFLDLFGFLLDGHNAATTEGVGQMLGRPARSLAEVAKREVVA